MEQHIQSHADMPGYPVVSHRMQLSATRRCAHFYVTALWSIDQQSLRSNENPKTLRRKDGGRLIVLRNIIDAHAAS